MSQMKYIYVIIMYCCYVENNIVIAPVMPQTYLTSLLQRINNSHYKLKNIWDVLKIIMLILIMPTPTFFTWQICNRDLIVESILLTLILVSIKQKKFHLVLTKLSSYDKYFINFFYHIPQLSTSNDATSNWIKVMFL